MQHCEFSSGIPRTGNEHDNMHESLLSTRRRLINLYGLQQIFHFSRLGLVAVGGSTTKPNGNFYHINWTGISTTL
jgi:hypothetical protein